MDSFLIHIYFSCSSNIYYLWKIETFAQYIFVVQTDTKVINIVLVVHIVLDCLAHTMWLDTILFAQSSKAQ